MIRRKEFQRLVASIGLDDWTPSEFRDCTASLMSDADMPIQQVTDQLGHKDLRKLEKHYRHRIPPVVTCHCSAPSRADDTESSDINLLVEFEEGSSLFDLVNLQEALEQLLGVSVDVVSLGGLKDRDVHIRREAVPI